MMTALSFPGIVVISGAETGTGELGGDVGALLQEGLSFVALAVGLFGAAILLIGVLRGVFTFLRMELHGPWQASETQRAELRRMIGYYLLLGLEFLVAADILETILAPTLDHVLVLGGVVLIRTVISFSLNWELYREREVSAREAVGSGSEEGAEKEGEAR